MLSSIDASRQAYRSSQRTVGEKLARVSEAIHASKVPLTCEQIEDITGLPHTTVSARLYDLAGKGKNPRPATIKPMGKGETRSGHEAVTWGPVFPRAAVEPRQTNLTEALSPSA